MNNFEIHTLSIAATFGLIFLFILIVVLMHCYEWKAHGTLEKIANVIIPMTIILAGSFFVDCSIILINRIIH